MRTRGAAPGTAIVTGGASGIGGAAARLLANDGWSLVIVDQQGSLLDEACADLVASGAWASPVVGDVSRSSTAEAAIARAREAPKPLRGLVCCAASRHAGSITEITEDQWDRTVEVVLKGVFLFCKAAMPLMTEHGLGGSIVNVSSPDSHGRRGMVAYSAAKAGVNALSACLAADHLADRVRVNVVHPGFTLTGMTRHYSQELIRAAAGRSVAGRVATPEDVAPLIRFLMSAEAETFTGGVFGAQPMPNR